VSATLRTAAAARAPAPAARRAPMRRQCACGTHTVGGITCTACGGAAMTVQRTAIVPAAYRGDFADEAVAGALASPAEPLAADLRQAMEHGLAPATATLNRATPASGSVAVGADDDAAEREARRNAELQGRPGGGRVQHDFSGVRLHAGPRAAASAAALGARAFTIGQDIVFGLGAFAPHRPEGLRLIAHELTHVAQQRATAPAPALLQRESLGRTVRDILFFIPSLFGAEINYSDEELTEYLNGIVANNHIDGGYYSDNKARQVVKRWRAGDPKFVLDTNKKRLLIQEMLDGIVTGGDREGILSLLESAGPDEAVTLLSPANVDFASLLRHLDSGSYKTRLITWFMKNPALHKDLVGDQFVSWFVDANFDKPDRALADRILRDILAVGSGLDFSDAGELKTEIFKRLRVSQLLTESQGGEAGFAYPENMSQADNCDGFDDKNSSRNARVNKAARTYWNGPLFDSGGYYFFVLTAEGRENAFTALTTLFTPQHSLCDKTLIHCDYLVNVLQFRTYAEQLGEKKFNELVEQGKIDMWLNWNGFPDPHYEPRETSPKAQGFMQNVQVAKREDLIIGDHVVFWNHLAFDGLNMTRQSPWRLENAILVDKDASGQDIFQGHGSGREVERAMLSELLNAYNDIADPALAMTKAIDDGNTAQQANLQQDYPGVLKDQGRWVVRDPTPGRAGHLYELKHSDKEHPETEPLLPGLRDPLDFNRLSPVDRPIESAPGRAPAPP
jgi:hypothetical protein